MLFLSFIRVFKILSCYVAGFRRAGKIRCESLRSNWLADGAMWVRELPRFVSTKNKTKKKEEAKGTNRNNEEIKLRKGKTERKMLIADFFNKEEWINIDVDNLCVFADIGK